MAPSRPSHPYRTVAGKKTSPLTVAGPRRILTGFPNTLSCVVLNTLEAPTCQRLKHLSPQRHADNVPEGRFLSRFFYPAPVPPGMRFLLPAFFNEGTWNGRIGFEVKMKITRHKIEKRLKHCGQFSLGASSYLISRFSAVQVGNNSVTDGTLPAPDHRSLRTQEGILGGFDFRIADPKAVSIHLHPQGECPHAWDRPCRRNR